MRYGNLFLIYGLIFLFCLSHAAHSEDGHGGTTGTSGTSGSTAGGSGERSTAPKDLAPEMIALFTKYFNPSESYIKGRFEKTLPEGLAKSMDKEVPGDESASRNDDGISEDLSELFGQLSREQIQKLVTDLNKEFKGTSPGCGSAEAEKQARMDALTLRLIWAADFILETDKPRPKCRTREGDFTDVFKKYWTKTKEKNDIFHEKLKQAKEGNVAAIDYLKKNYDKDALLGFLENHADGGVNELAAGLASVLAEKNEKGHFLYGSEGGDDQTRVALGKDPKNFSKVLKELKAEGRGVSRLKIAESPYEAPTRNWVAKSLEKEYTPPKARDPKKEPAGDAGVKTAGLKVMTERCLSCHGPGKTNEEDFAMKENGEFDASKKDRVKDRAITKKTMPNKKGGGALSDGEAKSLEAWLTTL